MPPDLSVFDRLKSKADYDRENAQWELNKALTLAQVKKAQQLDVDQLGEQAFYKAAQGLPLSNEELAAAKWVDAKSGGLMFDPVTGAATQKPRISEKIGLPSMNGPSSAANGQVRGGAKDYPELEAALAGLGTPQYGAPSPDPPAPPVQTDDPYAEIRGIADRNPRLRQENLKKYTEALPNAVQTKQAINDFLSARGNAGTLEQLKTVFGVDSTLGTAYANAALLAKGDELYRLGVLNGPDLQQLQSALSDPRTMKGLLSDDETVKDQGAKLLKTIDDKMSGMAAGAGMEYQNREPSPAPSPGSNVGAIPMAAIRDLKADPQSAAQFDEIFGQGAAAQVLNGR